MRALKFLDPGGVSPYQRFQWPLPKGKRPGKWVQAKGPLEVCGNGIHATDTKHAVEWLRAELYEIELDDEVIKSENKFCARRGRLIRRVDAWDLVAFAEACAWRAVGHAIWALEQANLDASALRLARRRHDLEAAASAVTSAVTTTASARAARHARDTARYSARAALARDATASARAARYARDTARYSARATLARDAIASARDATASARAARYARDTARYARTRDAEEHWQVRYIERVVRV